jgi:hypothetical protein
VKNKLTILQFDSEQSELLTPRHCATAQAVSRSLSSATARVLSQVSTCGICGGQSGTEEGFLRVLRFPLPIHILPNAPYLSPGVGTIGQLVADIPSGLITPAARTTDTAVK